MHCAAVPADTEHGDYMINDKVNMLDFLPHIVGSEYPHCYGESCKVKILWGS